MSAQWLSAWPLTRIQPSKPSVLVKPANTTIAGSRQPVSIHPEGFLERLWPAKPSVKYETFSFLSSSRVLT
jgi:hypothetical protein